MNSFQSLFRYESKNYDEGAGGIVFNGITLLRKIGPYNKGEKFLFTTLSEQDGSFLFVKDEDGEETFTLLPVYE